MMEIFSGCHHIPSSCMWNDVLILQHTWEFIGLQCVWLPRYRFVWDIYVIIHQSLVLQREGIFLEGESLISLKKIHRLSMSWEFILLKTASHRTLYWAKNLSKPAVSCHFKTIVFIVCLSIHKDIQHTKNYCPYLKAVSSICILIKHFVVVTSYNTYHKPFTQS
jgi:hypothetical protein